MDQQHLLLLVAAPAVKSATCQLLVVCLCLLPCRLVDNVRVNVALIGK